MTDIKNSHIQGDLTISPSITDTGLLRVNLIEETTTSSGISILNSELKLGKKAQFKNNGSSSADIQLENSGNFKVINNTGQVQIFTSVNKGITISDTSGDLFINSTTDSIDENTGSFITNGGAVIGKTLNVKENINALDGLHLFKNTATQNVIDVFNSNINGKSSIVFKNSSDLTKLEIGYGNSGASLPLNDISFIQSVNGSQLLFRGDSQDSFKISTNGTLDFYANVQSTSASTGSLRLMGGMGISNTSDATSSTSGGSFTTAGGLSVSKKLFIGDTLNMKGVTIPSPPSVGDISFYIDTSDSLFKSKNSGNIVTVYQPCTTKGDLSTHNGTTNVRLPVGVDGYSLIANSATSSGLEWVNNGNSNQVSKSSSFSVLSTAKTIFVEKPRGCFFVQVYPSIENGASCNIFSSKSIASTSGVNSRFNSNTSLLTNGTLTPIYPIYQGLQISKNYTEGDGNYTGISNEFYNSSNISLSGTSWIDIGPVALTGCFSFSVSGNICATFILVKNISSSNTSNITRLVSSPSSTSGTLTMRWLSGQNPQIRKSNNNDDGVYKVVDNFQNSTVLDQITLTNTVRSSLNFEYYTNKSISLKIIGVSPGSPNAIFTISKNSPQRSGNVSSYRSPGQTSGELLSLFWDANSFLQVSKNGTGFNGVYDVSIVV